MTQPSATAVITATGRYFDLLRPHQSEFDIRDIAHALSHLCRYNGHCRNFYSVAQHSVLVSKIVPAQHALAGLLHDAAEAFLGDVASPLKALLPDYKRLEAHVEAAVLERFGLPSQLPACIKQADLVLLRTEQRDLMGAEHHDWALTRGVTPLAQVIVPLSPTQARQEFLETFGQLMRHQVHTYGSQHFNLEPDEDESQPGELGYMPNPADHYSRPRLC